MSGVEAPNSMSAPAVPGKEEMKGLKKLGMEGCTVYQISEMDTKVHVRTQATFSKPTIVYL